MNLPAFHSHFVFEKVLPPMNFFHLEAFLYLLIKCLFVYQIYSESLDFHLIVFSNYTIQFYSHPKILINVFYLYKIKHFKVQMIII